jgi:hypothetical protein
MYLRYLGCFTVCLCWWKNLREGGHLKDPDIDGMIILKWIFEKWGGGAWNVSIRLRTGTSVGLL